MAKEAKVENKNIFVDKYLKGMDKAAILMLLVGEDLAASIMKHLPPTDVQFLAKRIINTGDVTLDKVKSVRREFTDTMGESGLFIEGGAFAKETLIKAVGDEAAAEIFTLLNKDVKRGGFATLSLMEPNVVARVLKEEHPQIIALALSYLESDHSAQILTYLPERLRGEVILRVATLERVPAGVVEELDLCIEGQIRDSGVSKGKAVEGTKVAAEILNRLESADERSIMEAVEKASGDLASEIQEKMFVFVDFLDVEDRGMQELLKSVSSEVLILALKGADDDLKAKFFDNMSSRAATMLQEDIEAKGPVKLSDVEKAQQEVIKLAKKLEEEGKLMRGGAGGGGDIVV
jgi:flagellar motor switch protein FliG